MSECSRCGQPFSCAMVDGEAPSPCWCTQLPFLPRASLPGKDEEASCLCPDCLRAKIAEAQAEQTQARQ